MILLKGGQTLCAGKLAPMDVLIEGSRIVRVARDIDSPGAMLFDMHGCWVAPGAVDVHAHLREPGYAHKETIYSGTRSAAKGGITAVMSMPNLDPCPDSIENLAVQTAIIAKDAAIRVYPYASLTKAEKGESLSDIRQLSKLVKAFSDDGRCVNNIRLLEQAMRIVRECGGIIASHSEAAGYAGTEAESVAVERECELVCKTGCRYHFCHLSTKKSFDAVRQAKSVGADITCEVMPHHLFLDEEDVKGNPNAKMSPPLRSKEDREYTVQALLDGTADMIATDHAPHAAAEKAMGFDKAPNGIIGFETLLPLVYTGMVKTGYADCKMMQKWVTESPASRFGIPYSIIEEGAVADIVALDIAVERVYKIDSTLSKSKNTPFSGSVLYGTPVLTLADGRIVYDTDRRMQ